MMTSSRRSEAKSLPRRQLPRQATARSEAQSSATAPPLELLLKLEDDARAAASMAELLHLAANATCNLARARQVFVFDADKSMRLSAISGISTVDRNAPVVASIENVIACVERAFGLDQQRTFNLQQLAGIDRAFADGYPYREMVWLPIRVRSERPSGGLLLARDSAWSDEACAVGRRVSLVIAHAKALLLARPSLSQRVLRHVALRRWSLAAVLLCILLAMALPVPMTTLSPFEIVPRDAFVTAAPVEGVIEAVHVHPGQSVVKGQPLVQFSDTVLRNQLDIAEREVLVAAARLKKATQLAFNDLRGRHELRLAMADQALKTAQRDFARDMLARTTIHSEVSGVAIFADKQSLIGKPVAIGERIMRIARPSSIEAAIDVAVGDANILEAGTRAKLFFAHNPLKAREAKITFTDYRARARDGNQMAYRVTAELAADDSAKPRIGSRGTAKLYGPNVPLAFYLFRRPLAVARQWLGL